MAEFSVKAKDSNGALQKALIQAESESSAARVILDKGLIPITVSKVGKREGGLFDVLTVLVGRVSSKEKVLFARQIATMVNAGLPLVQSLNNIESQLKNKRLKQAAANMAKEIEGGKTFSFAMASYPDIFSSFYVALVKSGEDSGNLDKVLTRIADQLEKNHILAGKIRSALFYPIFVVGLVFLVMIFMATFVVPKFEDFYLSLNKALPLSTQIMLGIAKFFQAYWWLVLVLITGSFIGSKVALRRQVGREAFDKLKLKIPFFNGILTRVYITRFSRTLATLLASGITIVDSLLIVSDSVGNTVYKKSIMGMVSSVKKGDALSKIIKAEPLYPPLLGQMIAIGEETGEIDALLNKVANFYEEEVDNLAKNLSTVIEPVLLVFVGGMVLAFILSIPLPIYSLVFELGGA